MASIHLPSSGSPAARRPQLVAVPRIAEPRLRSGDAAALAAAGSTLDKDWIEACRARVQRRLSACTATPADEAASNGLPDLLVHALEAVRALRRREPGGLPGVAARRLRLPESGRRT